MKQNLHTHSIFCDGKDTIEEMTLEAISKGFEYSWLFWPWIFGRGYKFHARYFRIYFRG